MHDNPEPTEEEQEQAQTERGNEEESMRYPSDAQPDPPLETTSAKPPSSGEKSGSPAATRGNDAEE